MLQDITFDIVSLIFIYVFMLFPLAIKKRKSFYRTAAPTHASEPQLFTVQSYARLLRTKFLMDLILVFLDRGLFKTYY